MKAKKQNIYKIYDLTVLKPGDYIIDSIYKPEVVKYRLYSYVWEIVEISDVIIARTLMGREIRWKPQNDPDGWRVIPREEIEEIKAALL